MVTSAKAKNLTGPCSDCGAIVTYTKRGRAYPAHRVSKACLDRQTCTCGHLKSEHADERHECSAKDYDDREGVPPVQCGCITFEAMPSESVENEGKGNG